MNPFGKPTLISTLLALTMMACLPSGDQNTQRSSGMDTEGEEPSTTGVSAVDTSSEPAPDSDATAQVSSVFSSATFDVQVTEDVVYGQGLAHAEWRAGDGMPIDLLLDIYQPIRENPSNMPVVVLIHGGGFKGGTHKKPEFVEMARTFAERGWVAFSIDYRVSPHFGTLPEDYPEPPSSVSNMVQFNQWHAFYPACRDAQAAIRWIRSKAGEYGLNTDYITAIGGSAGSTISVALGVTTEDDCVSEISEEEDPTLATTHLEQSSSIRTVIDHWGSAGIVKALEAMNPGERFDETDAPMSIVHGTEDPSVPFELGEELKAEYERTGVNYAWYPLDGAGHGAWNAKVDGLSLTDLAFEFIVEQQELEVN